MGGNGRRGKAVVEAGVVEVRWREEERMSGGGRLAEEL